MKELVHFNTSLVTREENLHLPGMRTFKKFFSIYPKSSVFIDRSGTVKTPVRTASLFPIPTLRPFHKTYEDVCNERAMELLRRADEFDAPIYVAWSGGIDSTLILVSLLKHATPAQKERLVVLLTHESIAENPRFYAEHIRGNIRADSMTMFTYLLGTDAIIIGGENNDQVFGSDVIAKLINTFGPSVMHEKYRREVQFAFFDEMLKDGQATNFCIDLIERIGASAPVKLDTHYHFLWWLNFCVKWQFVVMRMLPYTAPRNTHGVTAEYMSTRYTQFYNTEDFQLWSMHNMDKKIKDTWNTYKWPAKDVIYAFTKDEEYRKYKQKRGSLASVLQLQRSFNFIDSSFRMHYELDASEYFEEDNDFARGER